MTPEADTGEPILAQEMTMDRGTRWLLLGIEVTLVGIALELASSGAALGLVVAIVGLLIGGRGTGLSGRR